MTKFLEGIEISFNKVIDEQKIIKEFVKLLNIPKESFWNWSWKGELKNEYLVDVSYIIEEESKYPLFIHLLFNQDIKVSELFELNTGLYFAKIFNTTVIVTDFSRRNYSFLEVFPNGRINRCEEGKNKEGKTIYNVVVDANLDYKTLCQEILANNS